jgi:hypothetical protein
VWYSSSVRLGHGVGTRELGGRRPAAVAFSCLGSFFFKLH